MQSKSAIKIVECHAEGEVGDVIVGGVAALVYGTHCAFTDARPKTEIIAAFHANATRTHRAVGGILTRNAASAFVETTGPSLSVFAVRRNLCVRSQIWSRHHHIEDVTTPHWTAIVRFFGAARDEKKG